MKKEDFEQLRTEKEISKREREYKRDTEVDALIDKACAQLNGVEEETEEEIFVR